ncbi:hypothetical protein Tco_0642065 [Tanacetum coccineum]
MTCPFSSYLEQHLGTRYNLFRLWTIQDRPTFLYQHASSIKAIVGNANVGADKELNSLTRYRSELVSANYASMGLAGGVSRWIGPSQAVGGSNLDTTKKVWCCPMETVEA